LDKGIYAANALFKVVKVAVVDLHFKRRQVLQALKALLPGISPSFLLAHLLALPSVVRPG
jgi:hypothetical protein